MNTDGHRFSDRICTSKAKRLAHLLMTVVFPLRHGLPQFICVNPWSQIDSIRGLTSKLNSLRQRQVAGVVDRVGLAAHVVFPSIATAFASAAGILFAAESATYFGSARAGIHIGDPAIAAAGA